MSRRAVDWAGLHNARDLGGLPVGSSLTRFGRFYRAPRLDVLTGPGWLQLAEAGVRTIVDLRNLDEIRELPIPPGVIRHHRPVEDQSDQEFMTTWSPHLNSPVYYSDVLTRWPEKIIAAFRCFVDAPEGGVLFHCGAGRDRTGMMTALLLQLAGVARDAIVDDYLISVVIMNDYPESGEPRLEAEALERWKGEVASRLLDFLAGWDCSRYLQENGFTDSETDRLRRRLLDPISGGAT